MSDLARRAAERVADQYSGARLDRGSFIQLVVDTCDLMHRAHTAAFVRAIIGNDDTTTLVAQYVSEHPAEYLAAERQERDEQAAELQAERDWLRLVAAAYSTEAISVTGNLDPKAAVVFVRDHETPLETRIDERGILVRTDALEAALRAALGEQ